MHWLTCQTSATVVIPTPCIIQVGVNLENGWDPHPYTKYIFDSCDKMHRLSCQINALGVTSSPPLYTIWKLSWKWLTSPPINHIFSWWSWYKMHWLTYQTSVIYTQVTNKACGSLVFSFNRISLCCKNYGELRFS